MTQLTDSKVFEAPWVCQKCELPPCNEEREPVAGECQCSAAGECQCSAAGDGFIDLKRQQLTHFLPVAYDVKEIHLRRERWREEDQVGPRYEHVGALSPERDGEALVDIPQVYVYHSPDGFEWGYGGSGPSDLALNILALFVPVAEAWRLHNQYMFAVIARAPVEGCTIKPESVREWVEAFWAQEVDA